MRNALLAILLLAACTSGQQQTSIASLEVALSTAETAAFGYKALPICGTPNVNLCQDPAIMQKIKDADNVAYKAIKSAEATAASGAAVDLTAASAAIAALQQLVATLPKGELR